MENNFETGQQQENAKVFYKSWGFWKPVIAIFIGGLAGYLYYYFVGCNSGSCAITSSPFSSILFGGFMGFFLVSSPCTRGKC